MSVVTNVAPPPGPHREVSFIESPSAAAARLDVSPFLFAEWVRWGLVPVARDGFGPKALEVGWALARCASLRVVHVALPVVAQVVGARRVKPTGEVLAVWAEGRVHRWDHLCVEPIQLGHAGAWLVPLRSFGEGG